jgi:hypothetical protein
LNSGPSSIEGLAGFALAGLRVTKPSTKAYYDIKPTKHWDAFRNTCTSNKSDVAFTGRNLERGTLIPIALSKN